jgi:hypothetical protein
MCARRFLMLILILTLMVVGGAFALFQWGGDVLLKSATPQGHFVPPPPRSGPDYAKLDAWIARPELGDNPAAWTPDGYLGFAPPPELAAAFYIHPTTYLERDRWNAPIDEESGRARAELFVRSQASAFSDVAQVWAPRYRQAAYGAFLLRSQDAQKALDLAYRDIAAAFDEFLKQQARDRPILLAGHSQGALHLMRLLRERGPALKGRLVAAYVVGWPISASADLPALGLPACRSHEQTGCLLSWMSFAEPANPKLILGQWEETRGPSGIERRAEDIVCVNPLTGTEGGAATNLDNPGTLVPTSDLSSARLVPTAIGARCEKGLLILDGRVPAMGPYVLPGNNYHVYDYSLFWGAIAEDAMRRSFAWR